jgi:polyphosphate kinase 2 (PPK2 family)
MNYGKEFRVKPGSRLRLKDFDPQFADKREAKHSGRAKIANLAQRLSKCRSDDAPWFVIPSDHKWFRNLAISHIIVETMERLHIQVPKATVNIADIRRKYHRAVVEEKSAK